MSCLQLSITSIDYKRKDPVFWIETKTCLNKYKQTQRKIPRYYSELEKLYIQLTSSLPHTLIPSLPFFTLPRFDKEGNQVQKQWWLNLQKAHEHKIPKESMVESKIQTWLNRLIEIESVQESKVLREFIESEIGFRPSMKTPKHTALLHISEKDMDPEFSFWIHQLNSFSNQLQFCLVKNNKLIQEHTVMADHWSNLLSCFVSYGVLERDPELFILYKSITKGCQHIYDVQRSQGLATLETIGSELKYQIKNVKPAQDAMQRRLIALSDYLGSKKQTESSLRSVERMRLSTSINRERASEAIVILENARHQENEHRHHYETLDENLRQDIEYKYKPHVAQDLTLALKEYATSQLLLEKKKLTIWQEMLKIK